MSYNISSCDVIAGELLVDPVRAVKFREEHAGDLPEASFLHDINIGSGDFAVIDPFWYGEGSGWSFQTYIAALGLTKGAADIVLTWEAGDEFSGLRVKDGVVTEMDVEFKLVPKRLK